VQAARGGRRKRGEQTDGSREITVLPFLSSNCILGSFYYLN